MSPTSRRFLSSVAPFWTWARAATRFVFLTMPMEGRWWQTVAVREGQIAAVETFQRREQALEAAGIEE